MAAGVRVLRVVSLIGLAASMPGSAAAQELPSVLARLASAMFADEMPVSPIQHVGLILKVLEYDRTFEGRFGSELHVAVVHRPDDAESVAAMQSISEAFDAWSGKTVKDIPISYSLVAYTTAEALEATARDGQVNVLYITPGNASRIADLVRVGESLGVLTATGVPDYVQMGVAVGIGTRADKPQILINLPASKSVGSEFDVSLLRIARVIR